jgi:hypothetical protein
MRLKRLFAAAAIVGGLVVAQATAVTPAFADINDLACHYDYVTFNACLNFANTDDINVLTASAGLDSFMNQTYAQEIIDHGGVFRASLWSDDNGTGHYISDLSLSPGWPQAQSDRLSVRLSATVSRGGALDEDFEDVDEIYAQISYFDYHFGTTKIFRTGIVHGDFMYLTGSEGLPGCFILC